MMISRIKRSKLGLAAAAIVAGLGGALIASPASADVATSDFTQSNLFPSSTVQDWGTLNISCNGTTCTVSLTPLNGATFFDTDFVDFNLASGATNVTLSSAITSDGGTLLGPSNVNGFGSFANEIKLPDGPSSGFSSTVTVFTVDYSGTAASLLVDNTKGWDAAGHIAIPVNGSTCTGFVGETQSGATENGSTSNCGTVPVPEPTSLALLGTGLIGLGMIGWFVNRRRHFYS